MATNQIQPPHLNILEHRKWQYQQVLFLLQYHEQVFWSKFAVFLLVQTVLMTLIGTGLFSNNRTPEANRLLFGGSLLGFLICFLWLLNFLHHYGYYALRLAQGREMENEGDRGRLLTQGLQMSHGESFTVNGRRFPPWYFPRCLGPRYLFPILIGLFGVAFGILLSLTMPSFNW